MKGAWPARRSHLLYFVLAGFDVLTVCAGLLISHSLMGIYVDSLAVNQAWAARVSAFSRLGELAIAANAPGNDVFASRNPGAEAARMAAASLQFQEHLRAVRAEIERNLPPEEAAPLVEKLDTVSLAMHGMTRDARYVFAYFQADQPLAASARMASMDKRHGELHRALADLRASVAASQQENLQQQLAAAAGLEAREYLIGVLVLLMVAGATFYGHRPARQAQADAAERERQAARLQASNEALKSETRRKVLALDALREANVRLQSLFNRTLELQEQKQQHIARELHEEVSQTLASLKLHLSATPALSKAGSLAEDVLHRLQNLADDLTPHGMEIVGLGAVLQVHLREWTRGHGLRVRFAERLRSRPPFRIESAAYRVAQEAVANATRHASARNLRVELRSTECELQLRVTDDGAGFEPRALRRESSLGIALMEQRVAMLGGRLEIRSAPAQGTSVLATFPLQRQLDWVAAEETPATAPAAG